MDQHKGLIIGLVLLLCLFALALALGFRPRANDKPADARSQNREASRLSTDSWLSVMDDLLAPLAPAVKPAEIQALDNHCRRDGGTLSLSAGSSCLIKISPAKAERRTLHLRGANNYQLLIPVDAGEACPQNSAPVRVRVKFELNEADSKWEEPLCWKPARDPQHFKAPVLAKGANLTLTCETCSDGQTARLALE
ncbi:hypothetical protein [Methylomonas koyamae]|uniref:hypothetical protein n=1 Tax=Methylomonas koyamae TaxID=702114 RepID=UPI000BC328C1|nr:hypothetical protein [Methylomonas koyamae]ATG91717.1 hypothetical protein MKLM6_3530 [Methylomonas koyamae]